MRGWLLAPAPWLRPPVDPAVTAWADEIEAAITARDPDRLATAQAVFRLPRQQWPAAPGITVTAPVEEDPTVHVPGDADDPTTTPSTTAPAPPPVATVDPLTAPTTGRRRGAWARAADRTKETPR